MQSATSAGKLQPRPPKKLLILVILVMGALTLFGFLMMIRSRRTQPYPERFRWHNQNPKSNPRGPSNTKMSEEGPLEINLKEVAYF
jgi:hypothetical protein